MATQLFSYRYRGEEYVFEIPAESQAEAEARLDAIQHTYRYDGVLVAKVPARLGWCARVAVAIQNFFREEK